VATGRVELPGVVAVSCRLRNDAVASYDFAERTAHAPGDRVESYGDEGTLRCDLDDTLYAGTVEDG